MHGKQRFSSGELFVVRADRAAHRQEWTDDVESPTEESGAQNFQRIGARNQFRGRDAAIEHRANAITCPWASHEPREESPRKRVVQCGVSEPNRVEVERKRLDV